MLGGNEARLGLYRVPLRLVQSSTPIPINSRDMQTKHHRRKKEEQQQKTEHTKQKMKNKNKQQMIESNSIQTNVLRKEKRGKNYNNNKINKKLQHKKASS